MKNIETKITEHITEIERLELNISKHSVIYSKETFDLQKKLSFTIQTANKLLLEYFELTGKCFFEVENNKSEVMENSICLS